jgi:hypothetical protein
MTALNFPPQPQQIGNTYVGGNGVTYVWDGTIWTVAGNPGSTGNVVFSGNTIATASGGNVIIQAGTQDWTFTVNGALLVPSPVSNFMFFSLDSTSYVPTMGKPTLDLIGPPWQLQGLFVYGLDGEVALELNNPFPEYVNPGYDSGDAFAFGIDITGIPNYTLTLTLLDVVLEGGAGWTANVAASAPPAYPPSLQSRGAAQITSGQLNYVLGADGHLVLPANVSGVVTAVSLNPGLAVGYTTANNVPTNADSGSGTGLTVDIVADLSTISSVTINQPGQGYAPGDQLQINQPGSTGNGELTVVSVRNISSMLSWPGEANLSVDDSGSMALNVGGEIWSFATDGTFYVPPGSLIKSSDGSSVGLATYDGNTYAYADPTGFYIDTLYNTEEYQWQFDNQGNLSLPYNGGIEFSNGTINTVGGGINVRVYNGSFTLQVDESPPPTVPTVAWTFDISGNLTLPSGGTINWYDGSNALTGGGGSADLGLFVFSSSTISTQSPYSDIYITPDDDGHTQIYIPTSENSAAYPISITNHAGNIALNAGVNYEWTFDINGKLTLPDGGYLDDNGGITRLGAAGDAGAQIGSADTQNYVTASNVGVTIQTLADSTNSNWLFDLNGDLTMPLHTRLNSGGVGNTNSAEFGTVVNTYGDNGVVQNSQIYMSAGTGEARILVNMEGHTLVYLGTEEVYNPDFTGMVAMDPNVRSQYAIALDSHGNILLGGAQFGGTLVSSDYVAGLGALNGDYNMNGIYVDTQATLVSGLSNVRLQSGGGQIWTFGQDGTTAFPNYAFQAADGTPGQMLATNGSGSVTWTTPPGPTGNANTGNITFVDSTMASSTNADMVWHSNGYDLLFAATSNGGALVLPDYQGTGGYGTILGSTSDTGIDIYTNENPYSEVWIKPSSQGGNVWISTAGEANVWDFDITGNVTIPAHGAIVSSNAMTIQTTEDLYLRTTGLGGIGMFSGNSQLAVTGDLGIVMYGDEIGISPNDEGYVLITMYNSNNFVQITGPVGSWTFDQTGNLTLPPGGTINWHDGSNALVGGGGTAVNYATYVQNATVDDANLGDNDNYPSQGRVSYTINSTPGIISTGLIVTSGTQVDTYVEGTASTGQQILTFTTGYQSTPFTVVAFVTTNAGTVYSAPATGTSGYICFPAGTLITMANGTVKRIEDITYADHIKVWDFDHGVATSARPIWLKAAETAHEYNLLTFSDGTTLRTVGHHHIFNKAAGRFTHTMMADTPIGTVTVNDRGEEITLISAEVISEPVTYYNLWTEYHLNCYADGVLTSNRFNNTYPIANMKFVKDHRVLRPLSEFSGIDHKWIAGLRLQEQPAEHTAGYIRWYVQARLEELDINARIPVPA